MGQAQPGTILVAVGDEILGGFVLDTNSHWLARQAHDAGYGVVRIEVVPDRVPAIVAAVRRAIADPDAARVVVSGGLGPTPDDRTLEAVGAALERPLHLDPDALAHITAILERMHAAGWIPSAALTEANRRMAVVPAGAVVLTNRRGMAPGLAYPLPAAGEDGDAPADRWLVVLPGVPRELEAMFAEEVVPRFFTGGTAVCVREMRYPHAVEAEFHDPMRVLEAEFPDVVVGSYPQSRTRELVIRARGADCERVEAALNRLREMRPGAA